MSSGLHKRVFSLGLVLAVSLGLFLALYSSLGSATETVFAAADVEQENVINSKKHTNYKRIFETKATQEHGHESRLQLKEKPLLDISSALPSLHHPNLRMPLAVEDSESGITRIPITAGTDDAGHDGTLDDCFDQPMFDLGRNEIYIGHCKEGDPVISGLRFQNVSIPTNEDVEIYIEFYVETVYEKDIAPILISADTQTNSPTFSGSDLPSNRQMTSTKIEWRLTTWAGLPQATTLGVAVLRTPPLNDVIDELLESHNWDEGDPITFLLSPKGEALYASSGDNHRRVIAYERELIASQPGLGAAVLVIRPINPIYEGQDWNVECPFCNVNSTQSVIRGIHPRTGAYVYRNNFLRAAETNDSLYFDLSYISVATNVYSVTVGPGWTHNYAMQLEIPDLPNPAPTHTVIFQAPGGSRFPYYGNGNGTYTHYSGVTADLAKSGSNYVITTYDQQKFTFDSEGKLSKQEDAAGNEIEFTYWSSGNGAGKLHQAVQGQRDLTYSYNTQGNLSQVVDQEGREVTLAYDTDGNLTDVTFENGALQETTTYKYEASFDHFLTEVIDPSGRREVKIDYDLEARAYQIWDGEGNRLVHVQYDADNESKLSSSPPLSTTTIITASGVVQSFTYDERGTLVDSRFICDDSTPGCQTGQVTGYNKDFKPGDVQDGNGGVTHFVWDFRHGSNLEEITDALSQTTRMKYDDYNNLLSVVNAKGITTTFGYHYADFPTFRTHITQTLGNEVLTTIYTPTTAAEDGVDGYLKAQKDPDGLITAYDYNGFGQPTKVIRAVDTTDAVTTTYGYDDIGRLITTTQMSANESHTSLNAYDGAGRLIAAIANWEVQGADTYDDWPDYCVAPAPEADRNVCTRYLYDEAGRTISTTNALGQTNLTFYDGAGRVVTNVTNYDGTTPTAQLCTDLIDPDPEHNICSLTGYDEFGRVVTRTNSLGHQNVTEYNTLGRVSRSITNWEDGVFETSEPDQDIEMLYEYDAVGNTLIVTDTLGRMTHTFYDELNRTKGTISNWQDGTTLADCSDGSLAVVRDENVCTLYEYDELGQTTLVTDTLGRMNRTFYDDLNRVEGSVINWQAGFDLADCFAAGLSATRDEYICTLYGYDEAGRQITVTNALSQTSLTVYDLAGRAVIQVNNWDESTTILPDGTGCADTASNPQATENLCTVTSYDALGRRASSTDVLGNVTEYAYDGLGRLITTTRTLDSQPVRTVTTYDALGNRLAQTDPLTHTVTYAYDSLNRLITTTTPMGVVNSQSYNAAGWVLTRTNGLGQATSTAYDALGRRLAVTDPENNTTQYEYDALGNQVVITDVENIRTTYLYDGLNRLQGVIENDVPGDNPTHEQDVLTQYQYDALGNRLVITNALGYTGSLTLYDDLNRPLVITDALSHDTHYQYDVLGHQVVMTDGNGAVTEYAYDDLNRLITTTYASDNESVAYSYDAAGKRLAMQDSLGTTRYLYDDFSRLISVTNPFTGTVLYAYNLVGNRTGLTYPDGKVVTYTYDADNHIIQVEDWDDGTTSYAYDGASRLITTTLPNGVVSVNVYDAAGRLLELTHTASDDSLIARYEYVLDKVGNRTVVTETVLQPGMVPQAGAFLEENGLLVVEAESGQTSAGGNTAWVSQTVQAGYSGAAYLRAIPDVGELLSAAEAESGPQVNFPVAIETTGTYTVWVRAMAADGGGDSVHVGLDGQVVSTADNLTGFAPNTWGWSRLTLDSGNATLSLGSSGAYTLGLFMREDGIRVDKLLLITDTNYIPTGLGPEESQQQVVTGTTSTPVVQIVILAYDPLHRLSEADYSGAYTATYGYAYDAVDNRTAYTTTITSTTVITYQYDAANRLVESVELGGDTTTYEWDNVGRLITTTVGVHVGRVYTYSQDGDMLAALVNGLLTAFDYDGDGNRLRMAVAGEVTTYTLDYAGGFRLLLEEGGAFSDTKHYLYGLECIAELVDADETESEWRFYQRDGSSLVRQTTNMQATVTLAWTYSPEGAVLLGEEGPVTNLDCSGNTIYDFSTGLIFKNGRYFDPNTGIWVTMSGLVVYQGGWLPYNRKRGKGKRRLILLWVLLFFALALAGCGTTPEQPEDTCPLNELALGERSGDLPPSVVDIKYSTNGGETIFHKGTAIGNNAILTSNHWLPNRYNVDDITDWEILNAQSQSLVPPITGSGDEITAAGDATMGGGFDLVVFDSARGNLVSTSPLGNASALNVDDRLEQAVIAGGADGLYVVELITRNAQGNAIKIQPDITQPTDSGMGLFKNNALYGVNIGGDGWYGSIDNPGFIQNQIQVLNASL